MKHLLPVYLLLLAGCGGMTSAPPVPPTVHPNYQRFNPDAVKSPAVLIVGDSIVNAWCSAALLAQNPTWACQGSPAGVPMETSTEVLARFPKAVAASPKAIVIEVGSWDLNSMATNGITDPCNTALCANVRSMIAEATNAGIDVVVCTTPPWGAGPAATDNGSPAADDAHERDLSSFNITVVTMADSGDAVWAVDMYALLAEPINDFPGDMCTGDCDIYLPSYTDDGINPNTLGGQMMTQAVQTALTTKASVLFRRHV